MGVGRLPFRVTGLCSGQQLDIDGAGMATFR